MPSPAIENYAKQLWLEQQKRPDRLVPMGQIAKAMSVTPGTVTTMIKSLADAGLAEYRPRSGVRLTRSGELLALRVLRRHRLLETFLVKILGLDWSAVHVEAEHLEHAVSDEVVRRLDALLGHPSADPHGDPIPTPSGVIIRRRDISLAQAKPGATHQIVRVVDDDARFLQFARANELVPDRSIRVVSMNAGADALVVANCRGRFTMGTAAASRIFVRPAARASSGRK